MVTVLEGACNDEYKCYFKLYFKPHCFIFIDYTGLQWALHTSQHQNMNGWGKTQLPGYCLDATTRG